MSDFTVSAAWLFVAALGSLFFGGWLPHRRKLAGLRREQTQREQELATLRTELIMLRNSRQDPPDGPVYRQHAEPTPHADRLRVAQDTSLRMEAENERLRSELKAARESHAQEMHAQRAFAEAEAAVRLATLQRTNADLRTQLAATEAEGNQATQTAELRAEKAEAQHERLLVDHEVLCTLDLERIRGHFGQRLAGSRRMAEESAAERDRWAEEVKALKGETQHADPVERAVADRKLSYAQARLHAAAQCVREAETSVGKYAKILDRAGQGARGIT